MCDHRLVCGCLASNTSLCELNAAALAFDTVGASILQAWMCLGEGRLGVVAWLLAMPFVLPTLQARNILSANVTHPSWWHDDAKLQILC